MDKQGRGRPIGGNKLEKTKLLNKSDVRIDPSVQVKRVESEPEHGKYKCTCCGKIYSSQKGNFSVSNSPLYEGNNGYLSICRNCVEKYYQQLIGFYSGNEEHALEHCCRLFDWYYSDEAVAMTKNSNGRTRVFMYPSKMNMVQIRDKGKTYLDTLRDRHDNKIMTAADIVPQDELGESGSQVKKETVMFFGFGYTDEEYMYLEDQYADWTTRYECKTKAQEELFKSICIAQLTIQRAQRSGSTKSVADAMKTLQDLLGTANIKPCQSNDNALADQNTFGTLIKKWENEQPIAEASEEWRDVDGIQKYIETYFLGHLCNLVHVRNDYEEAYRREMEKYTVKPPMREEEDLGETSLLDKFSDKGEKNDDS